MNTSAFLKAMTVGALAFGAQPAFATDAARALLSDDLALTVAGASPKGSTCGCSGRSDCTCKKGSCKCAKCGHSHAVKPMVAPLKGEPATTELPKNARLDATAGVFI